LDMTPEASITKVWNLYKVTILGFKFQKSNLFLQGLRFNRVMTGSSYFPTRVNAVKRQMISIAMADSFESQCRLAGSRNVPHRSLLRTFFLNPLLFASCTDTVKLLEAWRGVLSSTPPYR
jgi:hypothetical protein